MDVQSYAGLKLKIPANLNMRRSRACNGANFFTEDVNISDDPVGGQRQLA